MDTPPIRLIVSDIDGTLVHHDKTLSDGNVAAIVAARAAGIAVSLISARPPSGMRWIAERLALSGPYAAFNGATIVGADGRVIAADHLAREAARAALAAIEASGASPWLFADGQWHARDLTSPHIAREVLSAGVQPTVGGEWDALLDRVDKLVGVSDAPDLLVALEGKVDALLGETASVARSQPYFLDVMSPAGNKGHGLQALARDYGVAEAAVAALGDQNNDLAMFARAGLSVAMGQAPDNVRAAASHVARSNDEDGVADAIERFVLPLNRAPAKPA